MPFDVIKERDLLWRLATLHDDGDLAEAITASDLEQPSAQEILKELTVDDYVTGDLNEKAKKLTEYYSQIKVGLYLNMSTAEVKEDGAITFSDYKPFDPFQFKAIYKINDVITQMLHKRLHPDGKKHVPLLDPRPNWEVAVHEGGVIKVSDAVLEEFKKVYNCKTEQKFLLLMNKETKVIDRVLRPRYGESPHNCSFPEGWVNYVYGVLKAEGDKYEIVGDYHSHPGLMSEGYAGYRLSPDDPNDAWEGIVQMVGHAETLECDSNEFDDTFRIGAFGPKQRMYSIEKVHADGKEVYLDNIFQDYEKQMIEFNVPITLKEIEHWFGYVSDKNEYLSRALAESLAIFKKAKSLQFEITSYYNDSYTLAVVPDGDDYSALTLYLEKTCRRMVDNDVMKGCLSPYIVSKGCGYAVHDDDISHFMFEFAALLFEKLPRRCR